MIRQHQTIFLVDHYDDYDHGDDDDDDDDDRIPFTGLTTNWTLLLLNDPTTSNNHPC